jgi:hypothetical protein
MFAIRGRCLGIVKDVLNMGFVEGTGAASRFRAHSLRLLRADAQPE